MPNPNRDLARRTTDETPGSLSTSSASSLSLRDRMLAFLIQSTNQRRGLPLLSVEDGELDLALVLWRQVLQRVPDEYLQRSYNRAADNWDWFDTRRPFTPDSVFLAFQALVAEDREKADAERRASAFRHPGTYACRYCLDAGYQAVYVYRYQRWYSSARACCCDTAPTSERNEPPDEYEFLRDRSGRYARRADLEQYGPPDDGFAAAMRDAGIVQMPPTSEVIH